MTHQDPLQTFREIAAAINDERWSDVARCADPVSLRLLQRQILAQFNPATIRPSLTVETLQRHQPELPRAVAEYQVAQMQKHQEERLAHIGAEVADVNSYEELQALSPEDLFARWLEARSLTRQVRQFLATHPRVESVSGVGLPALPREHVEVVGVIEEGEWAHVLFRQDIRHHEPKDESSLNEFYANYAPDEVAYLR